MLPRLIQTLHHRYQSFWNRERVTSLLWAFLFFGIALTFQKYADEFVVSNGGTVVRDLFLDIIPALDIDGIIISTTLIFTVVATLLGLSKPEYIIFSIKSIALFVVIRGFFIMLTHLGIHPDQIVLGDQNIGFFFYDILYNTKNDFFFSGHTGIPFLMFLIYYREPFWRHVFLATSILFGSFVLIGHMHYSIDVFAAPFMTYSIFSIAKYIFERDYHLIQEEREKKTHEF